MIKYFNGLLQQYNFQIIDESINLWGDSYDYFIIQNYDKNTIISNEKENDFFNCNQTNDLISKYQSFENTKMRKNISLYALIKVDNLQEEYYALRNHILNIEEDEYYFRKYIILYTDLAVEKLENENIDLIEYIYSSEDNEKKFEKFERNMFFEDLFFIVMQLIIKIPFISLPHTEEYFESIETKIEKKMSDNEELSKNILMTDKLLEEFKGLNTNEINEKIKSSNNYISELYELIKEE
ncbi:hypothetical protein KFV08_11620 [Macrococcoides canis]|uniref:ABC-three component system middle component 1 n=1 Tax=Macrococcoides canis TaxID=1855823 RepID=UPI00207C6858|nr:ABC-three component system middle component 1 [Macrococcus canis]MCO4097335.1 hypothetical protein [Macrococcus canis]UTH09109.1 hypothetical protein KFV08_11620 [Macrococcus canis]